MSQKCRDTVLMLWGCSWEALRRGCLLSKGPQRCVVLFPSGYRNNTQPVLCG